MTVSENELISNSVNIQKGDLNLHAMLKMSGNKNIASRQLEVIKQNHVETQ